VNDDARFYREHGYVHLRGVFGEREVEELRAAIDRILATVGEHDANHAWEGVDKATVLKGFHNLQYHDAAFLRAVAHPPLVAALVGLLGPNVQLHHTKMLVKPPERGAPFPMHQDHPYFPHTRHTPLAASVHLDDADEANGCLRVVPGTHALGPLPADGPGRSVDAAEYPLERGTPVPARAGDVVVFNYLTIHGSGVNRSDRTRRNVLFQYRDPEDAPALVGGREEHVDWGQGLMVAGHNPCYWQRRPRFELVATG
jgi:ectoine hydroxylase-related dioxygenase (phytanoyl-CoA dioxygenase family)